MQSGVKNVDEEVKILILLKVESVVGFQVDKCSELYQKDLIFASSPQ